MTIKRRNFIQKACLLLPAVTVPFDKLFALGNSFFSTSGKLDVMFSYSFHECNNRTWIGENFWSIPLEDWEIAEGKLRFTGLERNSRLNILTYTIGSGDGNFELSATMGLIPNTAGNGTAGFTVGIKDTITDPDNIRSACYYGKGISVGVTHKGELFVNTKKIALPATFDSSAFTLQLTAIVKQGTCTLKLLATDRKKVSAFVAEDIRGSIDGLVALEANALGESKDAFWCRNVQLSGTKVKHEPKHSFGPILWTMYTLSNKKLKIMCQLPPVGKDDSQQVTLQLKQNGKWIKKSVQQIAQDSYTAHFVLNQWNHSQEVPYQMVYVIDGKTSYYEGLIRKEPLNGTLKFGGLTCQHWGGYPYSPLVKNLEAHNPDLLYFSGDQLYEENGGYSIKREPEEKAIMSYLGKWFMFGWVFGHLTKDRPTICTPDDHDVFHGNLWGEGGAAVTVAQWEKVKDAHGGFVQTPKMVNVVNLTQCGHLPDPYQKTALPSGITNWFTELVYGKVSFAIVSDRVFKSGPQHVRKGKGRIDHVTTPLKPDELETDRLEFLGNQQMQFLNQWVENWTGADMKVLLSQTLFANVGTHHGSKKMFLYGDMDSGGWPKHRRDEVIRTIRKVNALHINGDQHLPFLVQYSVDGEQDGGWTFCTPAISTGYARWGQPDLMNQPFKNRPKHNLINTGLYKDVFGNDNFIYAVGNPDDDFSSEKNRYLRAQKKSSGFGVIHFDTLKRSMQMEAFRFLADKNSPKPDDQFPGWPLTINESDNDGRKPVGYLPRLVLSQTDQLVKIIKDDSKELVKVIRIKDKEFEAPVYENVRYTLIVGEGKLQKTIEGIAIAKSKDETLFLAIP